MKVFGRLIDSEFLVFDRLQGIVGSMSRVPTFRRRFRNLVKILYIEAMQAAASANHIGGMLNSTIDGTSSIESGYWKDTDETVNVSGSWDHENGNIV